jgi:hypothetical protein
VRVVLGAVDGIEESARLLLCLFEQGRERGDIFVGLTFPFPLSAAYRQIASTVLMMFPATDQ